MSRLNVILGILATVVFFSCSTTVGNQEHKTAKDVDGTGISKKESETKTTKPEYLSFETFKEKVWDFEESPEEWKYKGDTPCVIDFYADWCKPCKMVAPIMDEMSQKYEGKVKIYKINTDKERKLASVFRIRSIPAVLFVPMKGKPSMQTGALPRNTYIEIIENELLIK
ncbi:MAG: thioredoxin [Chlorobi bacterium]|nr:thioredoxin [Chlorobiota bacterium]